MSLADFMPVQTAVLEWFTREGRDLPWRHTRDPYAILVSEMMLQQTQVERVLPKYLEFLGKFPTFRALATAATGDVLRTWAPLGYNKRAVCLQLVAKQVVEHHAGMLPADFAGLRALEGVGVYTASALECFSLGREVAVVDVNVRRVLARVFRGMDTLAPKEIWALAREALPEGMAWVWNQALMDLGATVCTSRKPACSLCPVRAWCRGAGTLEEGALPVIAEARTVYKATPFRGSSRYFRGRVLANVRDLPDGESMATREVGARVGWDKGEAEFTALIRGMEKDGLLRVWGGPVLAVSLP